MLQAPGTDYVSKSRVARKAPALRRDLSEDFAPRRTSLGAATERVEDDDVYVAPRRFSGLRFRLRGGIPRSTIGRGIAGTLALVALAGFTGALWEAHAMLLRDPLLVIESSASIQITGNNHMTRPQLLSVFGEDVDRNILTVPLSVRRTELEQLPWVEHATVMRLLPNKFRVAIVERTPVAFFRQGGSIGLVDANGVLLDMTSDGDTQSDSHYSFPVVTGLSAQEPLSTRAARMKLFTRFVHDLDEGSGSERISRNVSEVDLSSPEDVKALIPDGKSDILVHFGDTDFLRRYELFEKNLPGWKRDYPALASADMRYERQVVLQVQPGTSVPVNDAAAAPVAVSAMAAKKAAPLTGRPARLAAAKAAKKHGVPPPTAKPLKSAAKPTSKAAVQAPATPPAGVKVVTPFQAGVQPLKSVTLPLASPSTAVVAKTSSPAVKSAPVKPQPTHLQTAFDVHAKTGGDANSRIHTTPMQAAPQ